MITTTLRIRVGTVTALMLVALSLATFAGSASAAGSSGAAAGASAAFTDPAGDSQGAPDVTKVAVSDTGAGMVTISVTATELQPETDIWVVIDADKNSATGSRGGNEYELIVWRSADERGWDIDRWTGSKWESMPQTRTMSFNRSAGTVNWVVSRADLGGTTGFSFYVSTTLYDANDEQVAEDNAPDGGEWVYDLSVPATAVAAKALVRPLIGEPATNPAAPLAGKRLSVSFPVTRSDTGAALKTGTITGDLTVAGRPIPHAQTFRNGTATISFLVPATANGRLLKLKLTVTLGGQSAIRSTTVHVS